jgi:hypothetical protein
MFKSRPRNQTAKGVSTTLFLFEVKTLSPSRSIDKINSAFFARV